MCNITCGTASIICLTQDIWLSWPILCGILQQVNVQSREDPAIQEKTSCLVVTLSTMDSHLFTSRKLKKILKDADYVVKVRFFLRKGLLIVFNNSYIDQYNNEYNLEYNEINNGKNIKHKTRPSELQKLNCAFLRLWFHACIYIQRY